MKLYVIAYFYRCVEPDLHVFTDEKKADAKVKEITSRDDYSPQEEGGEDCISYQILDVSIPQVVEKRRTVEGEQRHKAREAAETLINFTNNSIADVDEFSNKVTTTHRTLQQSVMRVFMSCVHKWAKMYEEKYYDARNEATCFLAHNIHKAVMDKDGLPFI